MDNRMYEILLNLRHNHITYDTLRGLSQRAIDSLISIYRKNNNNLNNIIQLIQRTKEDEILRMTKLRHLDIKDIVGWIQNLDENDKIVLDSFKDRELEKLRLIVK